MCLRAKNNTLYNKRHEQYDNTLLAIIACGPGFGHLWLKRLSKTDKIPPPKHMRQVMCLVLLSSCKFWPSSFNTCLRLRSVTLMITLYKSIISCHCITKNPGFLTNCYVNTVMYQSSLKQSAQKFFAFEITMNRNLCE